MPRPSQGVRVEITGVSIDTIKRIEPRPSQGVRVEISKPRPSELSDTVTPLTGRES